MNKVMLVTGGSRGIGAATVRLGAKLGYAVAINYKKRADVAQNLMDEINDGGGKAIMLMNVARLMDELAKLQTFLLGRPPEVLRVSEWGIFAPGIFTETYPAPLARLNNLRKGR